MASANRYRVMHKFWLDLKKDNEDWLDEQIKHLKKSRKFTVILRDALRLILDLKAGRTDVLFELFPWVRETTSANLEKNNEIELKVELRHLQQLILERHDLPSSGSKYLAMKQGAVPIIETKSAPVADAGAIADNFLAFIQ